MVNQPTAAGVAGCLHMFCSTIPGFLHMRVGSLLVLSSLLVAMCRSGARWGFPCVQTNPSGALEGPIRCLLVRDGRAWVSGGRTEPWLALFESELGTQLDAWRCDSHGACHCMQVLPKDPTLQVCPSFKTRHGGVGNSTELGVSTVAEGCEDTRSMWRLLTGHDNGQMLVWQACSDVLQPILKVGETGSAIR